MEVLTVINSRNIYFTPSMIPFMEGYEFPKNRVAVVNYVKAEGKDNLIKRNELTMEKLRNNVGTIFYVCGRKNHYYTWDPTINGVTTYKIVEVNKHDEWKIELNKLKAENSDEYYLDEKIIVTKEIDD